MTGEAGGRARGAALALLAGLTLASVLVPRARAVAAARSVPILRYRITRRVRLGLPDKWDYVVYDAPSHRVYVAHGDRVSVVDGRSGRLLGRIGPIPGGTHGIAISHDAGLGYTVDGDGGLAVAFDLRTLRIVKRLKADADADAVTIDPNSGHVFVVDGKPGVLTVIDPKADRVVASVRIGSRLEYAVAGDDGKVYVNGEAKRVIFRIDTASNRVDATWPIPQCRSPHGLAIDIANHRLFSSCRNGRLVVVNAITGAVVAILRIGAGTDAAAFDPTRRLVFSPNGLDGTVSVIREVDADTYVPAATVRSELSARTMSLDPSTGRLYLAAAEPLARVRTPAKFQAARAEGEKPYVPGSLELLFLDPSP